MSEEPGLDAAYSLDGPDDVQNLYRRWASTYESGFITEMGYVYHKRVVAAFVQAAATAVVTDNEAVLDAGCGTGVGGVELARFGSWAIDGLDLSPEMLIEAGAKKKANDEATYRDLVEANVLEQLPIPSNHYGGVISIGTFTHGHVGPTAIDELVRVVRPGGVLCLGINEEFYQRADFGSYLGQLNSSGEISAPQLTQVAVYNLDLATNPHAADTALIACFSPC